MDAIGDFCDAIIVGLALEVEQHDQALAAAIHRIAREIKARHEAIGEVHSELFHAMHQHRHCLFDDGNGEVEEAAGAA
jgi:hypothetical protein